MKNSLKWLSASVPSKLIFLLILTFSFTQVSAQCISAYSTIAIGGSQTASTTVAAQSYYWSTSGPLTIVGSKTGSSVTIHATGAGTGTVKLSYFKGGYCYSCVKTITIGNSNCPYSISETIPMCWSASANCYKRRGSYALKNCNGQLTNGDWEVTPNNGGGCINHGCSSPGINRFYGPVFKPNPTCNWTGLYVTVKAYQPGTNNLWAQFNTIIQDCDTLTGFYGSKKTAGGDQGEDAESSETSLILPSSGMVTVAATHLLSGKRTILREAQGEAGDKFEYVFKSSQLLPDQLYSISIEQNGVILESRKLVQR